MEKLAGPQEWVEDAGKVQNRPAPKSWIVLINNIGRTLLLGLPWKQMTAPLDVLRFERLYLHQPWTLALMKTYLYGL